MLENPEGIYAIRCLTYWGKTFSSPIYGAFCWTEDWKTASCFLDNAVPCDKHGDKGGCGFHGLWEFNSVRDFIRSISGHCAVMVLCEYAGKIITHERGLRAQYCRVSAILNWHINGELSAWQVDSIYRAPTDLLEIAARHFHAPMVESSEANNLVRSSNHKIVVGRSGFQAFQL